MKRKLKPEEYDEIASAIAAGDRVNATNIYLSATEGNLTELALYVPAITREVRAHARALQNRP